MKTQYLFMLKKCLLLLITFFLCIGIANSQVAERKTIEQDPSTTITQKPKETKSIIPTANLATQADEAEDGSTTTCTTIYRLNGSPKRTTCTTITTK